MDILIYFARLRRLGACAKNYEGILEELRNDQDWPEVSNATYLFLESKAHCLSNTK